MFFVHFGFGGGSVKIAGKFKGKQLIFRKTAMRERPVLGESLQGTKLEGW